MKYLITLLLLMFINAGLSEEPEHPETKLSKHGSAFGTHGMAIFNLDDAFYASHMPLANSMHAHQIVFSFKSDDKTMADLDALNDQFPLLSMQPEQFDLAQLIDGNLTQFSADIYANHFERGGSLKISGIQITVENMVLSEPLSLSANGNFYMIAVSETSGLLVHQIGSNPSFDQVLAFERLEKTALLKHSILSNVTKGQAIDIASIQVDGIQLTEQLYLETQDFE